MSQAPDHAVLQAAADWFARCHASPGDARLQAQWAAWLAQDARHRKAWAYVESISAQFGRLQSDAEQADQVLGTLRHEHQSRRRMLGSLCAGLGGLLGWSAWQRGWMDTPRGWFATYRTGLGEIRPLVLADGTRVWLNSDTSLDVHYDPRQRHLRLYRGEILIETAPDARRFQVATRAGEMQPLGTRFSVLTQALVTDLSVFSGAVQATCADSGQQIRVNAGQALHFDATRGSDLMPAPAQRQDWTRRVLVAEDMPLSKVVDILGNYRHGHLGIDPAIAHLRAVGTYPLQDTDRALAMLERSLPIRIVRTLPWWVTLEPREKN